MTILNIILIAISLILLFIIILMIYKFRKYIHFFNTLQEELITILTQITILDINGAFENDDEVGNIWTSIKYNIFEIERFLSDDNKIKFEKEQFVYNTNKESSQNDQYE